jgi:hypothetical protein
MTFHKIIRDSIVAQFGSELAAGKHAKYPQLKEMWLDAEAERAEQNALVQACFEVAHGADKKWLQEN